MILFKPLSNSALTPRAMSPPIILIVWMATRHGIPPVHDLASRSLSDHYLERIPLATLKPDLLLDMPAKQTARESKGPSIQLREVEKIRQSLESRMVVGRSHRHRVTPIRNPSFRAC